MTREEEDALHDAFMLAYRIGFEVHGVKGEPTNFNETKIYQRLRDIVEVGDRSIALSVMRVLERRA